MKIFHGNEYNSCIHTAQNAGNFYLKVTSTGIVYEKTLNVQTHSNIYNETFSRR